MLPNLSRLAVTAGSAVGREVIGNEDIVQSLLEQLLGWVELGTRGDNRFVSTSPVESTIVALLAARQVSTEFQNFPVLRAIWKRMDTGVPYDQITIPQPFFPNSVPGKRHVLWVLGWYAAYALWYKLQNAADRAQQPFATIYLSPDTDLRPPTEIFTLPHFLTREYGANTPGQRRLRNYSEWTRDVAMAAMIAQLPSNRAIRLELPEYSPSTPLNTTLSPLHYLIAPIHHGIVRGPYRFALIALLSHLTLAQAREQVNAFRTTSHTDALLRAASVGNEWAMRQLLKIPGINTHNTFRAFLFAANPRAQAAWGEAYTTRKLRILLRGLMHGAAPPEFDLNLWNDIIVNANEEFFTLLVRSRFFRPYFQMHFQDPSEQNAPDDPSTLLTSRLAEDDTFWRSRRLLSIMLDAEADEPDADIDLAEHDDDEDDWKPEYPGADPGGA